jgi:tetrahydromethanopterin S-methyltransferase subunit F
MAMVEKAFSLVDNGLTSGVMINAILGLALGASMKRMFALINTLQILTHLPLMGF